MYKKKQKKTSEHGYKFIQSMQSTKAQNYKGPLLMKYFSEFIQRLIRSSTHHYQPIQQLSRQL